MADPATQPAAVSGITQEQLAALLAPALQAALKPYQDKLAELERNVGTVADTIKQLPPAPAAAKADDKGKAEPLTPEAVSKLVGDAIAADRKAQQDQAAKADAIKGAKAKVVAEKLNGDSDLAAYLPDTEDAAQLAAVADRLAAKVAPPVKLAGTRAEGGLPTARQPVDVSKLNASQKVQLGVDQMLAKAV